MYAETCVSISKIDNGFLLEVRLPYKDPKKAEKDGCPCIGPSFKTKTLAVKTAEECASMVAKVLPLLAEKDEFETAFEDALGNGSEDEE